ncbi:hypothetical protein XPN_4038, partial [Xanthomonas arboricola pv. pruni MAFF 301427]
PRRLCLPAQHPDEARAGQHGALLDPGTRLRPRDRLHRQLPDRAQADGADEAPVRLRQRHGDRLPAPARPGPGLQAQHRGQPRHAVGPQLRARPAGGIRCRPARQHRCQPRQPAERLGYRPVPDRPVRHRRRDAGGAAPGRAGTGRAELRCQGAPRVVRPAGSVPGAYRRHGRVRTRAGSGQCAADLLAAGAMARRALRQLRQRRGRGFRQRQQHAGGSGQVRRRQRTQAAQWPSGSLREPDQPVSDPL